MRYVIAVLAFVVAGCATLQKVPNIEACFDILPPLVTKEGLVCTRLCVGTNPPTTNWTCAKPAGSAPVAKTVR